MDKVIFVSDTFFLIILSLFESAIFFKVICAFRIFFSDKR